MIIKTTNKMALSLFFAMFDSTAQCYLRIKEYEFRKSRASSKNNPVFSVAGDFCLLELSHDLFFIRVIVNLKYAQCTVGVLRQCVQINALCGRT